MNGSRENGQDSLFSSASLDASAGEVILKVVNTAPAVREVRINLPGAPQLGKSGRSFVLSSSDLKAENSLAEPTKISPVERQFAVATNQFTTMIEPQSFTVMRIGVAKK